MCQTLHSLSSHEKIWGPYDQPQGLRLKRYFSLDSIISYHPPFWFLVSHNTSLLSSLQIHQYLLHLMTLSVVLPALLVFFPLIFKGFLLLILALVQISTTQETTQSTTLFTHTFLSYHSAVFLTTLITNGYFVVYFFTDHNHWHINYIKEKSVYYFIPAPRIDTQRIFSVI